MTGKGTTRQTIRIDDDLWRRLGAAAEQAGRDRSAVIRDLIRWYVREPDAALPARPD